MPDESFDESLFPAEGDKKAADEAWDAGKEETARGNPIGNFNAEIKSAVLGRSKSSDRLQISYELVIAAGEFRGVTIRKYDGLGSPQQTSITQNGLKKLGVDINTVTMKTLPAVLVDLEGKFVAITTKQNGDFYNIYFQRIITTPTGVGNDVGSPDF